MPEGCDALLVAESLATQPPGAVHLHIARDAKRMAEMADALAFFAPAIHVISFPAWDCLPYDRVSPNREVVSQRIDALTYLAARPDTAPSPSPSTQIVVLTSVNAVLQRVPARAVLSGAARNFAVGARIDVDELGEFFQP